MKKDCTFNENSHIYDENNNENNNSDINLTSDSQSNTLSNSNALPPLRWQDTLSLVSQSWLQANYRTQTEILDEDLLRVGIFLESEYQQEAQWLQPEISPWDWNQVLAKPQQSHRISSSRGSLWLIKLNNTNSIHQVNQVNQLNQEMTANNRSHAGAFCSSSYSRGRDLGGVVASQFQNGKIKNLQVHFLVGRGEGNHDTSEREKSDNDLILGFLVGLELGAYRYLKLFKTGEWPYSLNLNVQKNRQEIPLHLRSEAESLAVGINLSRHLVNLPANWLHPQSYAEAVQELFSPFPSIRVEIWDGHRLKEEKMNLLSAVGAGAQNPPCLIHLSYCPLMGMGVGVEKEHGGEKANSSEGPLAFVGKGITFDSGGLDIKPSRSMRLMKKDMGGSASLIGLAWWVVQNSFPTPCEFYLPVAENAVSSSSFRPGDVIYSRQGQPVEIHNTDAEGRLVLADALDLAIHPGKNRKPPRLIIDVATLTGAIKTALGADIAGFFSNDDQLAQDLEKAAQQSGDWCWRMPLYQPYRSQMVSTVAELVNSVDGFGGAITAALFLETFVGSLPWAHFDIYAWKNKPEGALLEPGGSGQMVQCLVFWLRELGYLEQIEN